MGTVQNDLGSFKGIVLGEGTLEKDNVPASRIINPISLTQFIS
ncbi:hypothetical protein ES703_66791 [subsurface metagenome]